MDPVRKQELEKQIKLCAVKFSKSKNDPSLMADKLRYGNELAVQYIHPGSEYGRYIRNKAEKDYKKYGITYIAEQPEDLVAEAYLESFRKYDHNKNDNFCAFFFDRYNFLLKKYIEKERKTKERTEDADDDTLNDISGDEAASLSSEIELSDTLSLLLSMASRFYQHYHGKECNETRRYYTELFTTDKSVCIIKDVCENLRHINENEFFGTINEKYLDFLMSEKCTTAADIVRVRFKTLGELTDNCDPRKKDDEPSQPFGNGIYKKFIFEDKGIKVTDSAISQQKKAFDERIKTILSIK